MCGKNRNGHCYLEFIEKDPVTQVILARARGTIWANTFQMLSTFFEGETGQPFTSGLKVLVRVSVEFHEIYGFSLNVVDIDPTFTVGEMAKKSFVGVEAIGRGRGIDIEQRIAVARVMQSHCGDFVTNGSRL